jgi:hypothetical protein
MKLTVDENLISELTSIREELTSVLTELGRIEVQINYLENEKKEILKSFYEFENRDRLVVDKIVDKYGEGKINLSTREIELFQ